MRTVEGDIEQGVAPILVDIKIAEGNVVVMIQFGLIVAGIGVDRQALGAVHLDRRPAQGSSNGIPGRYVFQAFGARSHLPACAFHAIPDQQGIHIVPGNISE